MPKTCLAPDCNRSVFSNKYCQIHQSQRVDDKYLKSKEKTQKKPVKAIPKFSKKRQEENKEYSALRKEFLARPENKYCRLYPDLLAETVHHPYGRLGDHFLKVEEWIPLSLVGHQWVEEHPTEAKKLKLSFDRKS